MVGYAYVWHIGIVDYYKVDFLRKVQQLIIARGFN